MIHLISDIDDKKWDDFVCNHNYGNIFQTTSMYDVYSNTKNYFPVKLCAIDDNKQIKGVLLGVLIGEMRGLLGWSFLGSFSQRSIIQGGPLVADDSIDVLPKLIFEFDKRTEKKSLYTQIWNLHDINHLFNNMDQYYHEEHLNFFINLDQSEKDVWSQLHKSRKKNINRANKKGVVVEEIININQIPIFYKLLQETYDGVKVPLADITLFESAFEHLVPKNMAKFYLARQNDTYIGARAVLTFNSIIHDWYAGASNEELSLYPNECLIWHILKWGVINDYKLFDFGGAGNPNEEYGPREFKRRFGGDLVNYGRYTHIHSPVKMKITDIGLKVYRRF